MTTIDPASWNAAIARAVEVARTYGTDSNQDIHNEPYMVAKGIETASRQISAAISALAMPSDTVVVPKEPTGAMIAAAVTAFHSIEPNGKWLVNIYRAMASQWSLA